jgi:hypothetical protein
MPPDVPAIVNAGVVVAVATETMPPVQPTDVTVPDPLPPLAAIEIPPAVLVMVIFVPAVSVESV